MKTRRRAVTLIEALVAIFIAAIGLLSILALFPLGAIKMAQAIQADRAEYTVDKASAVAEAFDIRRQILIYNPNPQLPNQYPDWFINNPVTNAVPGSLNKLPFFYDGPGYPLYIDPIGSNANMPLFVGPPPNATLIARQTVSFASSVRDSLYWFSLLDDIAFKNDGPNSGLAGSQVPMDNSVSVSRSNRYSYAYMLRRPRFIDPSIVDLSVVVYEKRPIQAASNEFVYQPPAISAAPPNNAVTGTSEVTLYYTTDRPPIRKGGWILDATVVDPATLSQNPPTPSPQGFFYRVTDVTEVTTPATGIALQLDQPLRPGSAQRVIVIMEGVVEVVERGSGWRP
jgi:hypothetical protein